ncbi:MAG: protocatechuate 3,4-dioxygenase beta subunit [Planctomycetota bacterium]|jgi:protocatechuate 3,4-dioxygenase beta subunit
MRNKNVLGLLAVVAGLVIGVVWFALEDSPPTSAAVMGPGISEPEVDTTESRLATPKVEAAKQERALVAPASESIRQVEAGGLLATVPEDQLRWIEGRLLLPDSAAWDATAVAISVLAPERKTAKRALFSMMMDGGNQPVAETEVLYSSGFAKDGSFRLGCAKDAEWAYLDIDARFLYLVEPIAVRLEGPVTSIDLTPLLGANIKGQWSIAGEASAVEREFTGGSVYLTTIANNEIPAFLGGDADNDDVFHRTWVAADGQFEMRGVDPDIDWSTVSHPPQLASHVSEELELTAGEEFELEIELVRGSRLSGRVEDKSGQPLFGARLFVSTTDSEVEFKRTQLMSREGRSRGDGSFDLYGIAPGEVRLNVELKGYRTPLRKKFTLEPGSEETGIVFKMRRGKALRGSVAWSNGLPAVDAKVEIGKDSSGKPDGFPASWRTRYGESQTDQAGAFEVIGLKSRKSSIWAWGTREEKGRWVEGVARLDGIKPTESADHRLVLQERPVVSGFVIDAEGNPVQDFEVEVRLDDGASNMFSLMSRQGQEVKRKFHALDGGFLLERLDRGDYVVSVIADGFATSKPVGFQVPFERDTAPLEITLEQFSSVTGIVTSPGGGIAIGATVTANSNPSETKSMLIEMAAPFTTTTNGRGEFRFGQLSPGLLRLHAKGDEWVQSADVDLELMPGMEEPGVELRLRTGAMLTVEVLDPEGTRVNNYIVKVSEPTAMEFDFSRFRDSNNSSVAEDGWVEFSGLTPGTATVTAQKVGNEVIDMREFGDESVRVSTSFPSLKNAMVATVELVDGVTTHVILGGEGDTERSPVTVTGVITRRGEPVEAKLTFVLMDDAFEADHVKVSTNEKGAYKADLSTAGDYYVTINRTGDDDKSHSVDRFCRVYPTESQRSDFRLHAARISGRILDPDGDLAVKIPVSLRRTGTPRHGESSLESTFRSRNETDENGEYAFDHLEPGTYIVGAGNSMFTLMLGSAGGYGRKLSDPVQLDADQDRTGVDLKLSGPVQLKGDVVDRDGNPVNGASIYVFDNAGNPVDPLSSTTSNVSGRFIYEGLSAGEYTIMARTKDRASPHSRPINVREGENARIKLELEPATILIVSLLDVKGKPIPASVGVVDENGRELNGLHSFGGNAMFFGGSEPETKFQRVGPISAGSYVVTARAEGYEEVRQTVDVGRNENEKTVELRLKE